MNSRRPKASIVGVVAIIGIAAATRGTWVGPAPSRQIATARSWAGLAPLPPSATQVHVSESGALTWTAYKVRFSASPHDINAFIAASPGLREAKAEVFTPRHMLLPGLAGGQGLTDRQLADNNAYITTGIHGPPWFDRTVREAGRRYTTSHGGNYGEVVINDATHTVYIYVADS